jgi:hypothetical protein
MAPNVNCWEFKKCERQEGGKLVGELGICPASVNKTLNGMHGGKNAGRACWAVAGTFCGGAVQGTEAQKQHNCWKCEFFQSVKKEETSSPNGFSMSLLGMKKMLEKA